MGPWLSRTSGGTSSAIPGHFNQSWNSRISRFSKTVAVMPSGLTCMSSFGGEACLIPTCLATQKIPGGWVGKIHHSPSSPFVSSTVVVCMSSSDSLWLPLEILDATTDFVEVSVVHYSVILLKSCGSVPEQCSLVPVLIRRHWAGVQLVLYISLSILQKLL